MVVAELVRPVAGLSFSSAMHSLIGLDAAATRSPRRSPGPTRGRPGRPSGCGRRRPGWPCTAAPARRCIPMSPLPKLLWFAEQEPKLFEQVAHWVGIKDWVLLRLCDALVIDHSIASATGLMDIHDPGVGRARR